MMRSRITDAVGMELYKYSSKSVLPMKLSDLLFYGKDKASYPSIAPVVYRELCTRLAHQARRLDMLYSCKAMDQLLAMQIDAFKQLRDIKHLFRGQSVTTGSGNSGMNIFLRCLREIEDREATTLKLVVLGYKLAKRKSCKLKADKHLFLETLMEGVASARLAQRKYISKHNREPSSPFLTKHSIDQIMQSTIGINTLIEHFRACAAPPGPRAAAAAAEGGGGGGGGGRQRRVGVLAHNHSLHEVVAEQAAHAAYVAERALGASPPFVLQGHLDARATFVYSHISHVLFEVIKNAMKATLNSKDPKSIVQIRIVQGESDVSVLISDQGGGMSRRRLVECCDYLSATSESFDRLTQQQSYQPPSDPLTGTGTGLPVSQLYARHFGGDLRLVSLEGHGTLAALYLPLDDPFEAVPLRWSQGMEGLHPLGAAY